MANKFNFRLLTSADPQAQYDAIQTKDALTFYLLNNGVGYLGDVPLFGGDAERFMIVDTTGEIPTPYETGKLYCVVVNGVRMNGNPLTLGLYYAESETSLTNMDQIAFLAHLTDYIAQQAINSTDENLGTAYEGDDATIMTSKAVATHVSKVLNDISLLKSSFFRTVEMYTITDGDIANKNTAGNIYMADSVTVGEEGLLFTRDDDMDDDGATDTTEQKFFISLKGYIDIYQGSDTETIDLTVDTTTRGSFTIKADLKIQAAEDSIVVNADGIALTKSSTLAKDLTAEAASSNNLVTEKVMVEFLRAVLEDYVTYGVDDGTTN